MLNAVDKKEKLLPYVAVKVAAAASFSASITGIFFRFSRLGISTGRLKSRRLNPLERFHFKFGYFIFPGYLQVWRIGCRSGSAIAVVRVSLVYILYTCDGSCHMIKIEAFMADGHAVGTEQRFLLKLSR